jgi:YVTN family beta-propeller protein
VKILIAILFVIGFLLTSAFSLNDALAEENTVIDTIASINGASPLAFDSANNRMYVTQYSDSTVSVINTATNAVDAIVTVGLNPIGIAFDSANNRMYVTNNGANTVSVINTATNNVDESISVGTAPWGIAFDSANNRMYVTNKDDNTVSVINTATNNVDATIAVGSSPRGIAFDSANNRMYITNNGANTVSVIDTAANKVDATISVGTAPWDTEFDSANNRMYVTNFSDSTVSVINTATNAVDATISVEVRPRGIAFDSANNRMYVTNNGSDTVSVINTATNNVDATIAVGGSPWGIAFDSANNRMYVTNNQDGNISVIDIKPVSSGDCYDCTPPTLESLTIFSNGTLLNDSKIVIPVDTPITFEIVTNDNRGADNVAYIEWQTDYDERPSDMNYYYANHHDKNGNVSLTFYEWKENRDDVAYNYSNNVTFGEPEITLEDNLTFAQTITWHGSMAESELQIVLADYRANSTTLLIPVTLEVIGTPPIVFDSNANQKVPSFSNEPVLLSVLSQWSESSNEMSELSSILGISDELPSWTANLATWVVDEKITLAEMIIAIEHVINL